MNLKNTTDERIRWQNSLTNANAAVQTIVSGDPVSIEDFKKLLEDVANWFYNIEPKVTELHKMIEECTTISQLEELKDVIKHTDSITMFNLWNDAKLKMK